MSAMGERIKAVRSKSNSKLNDFASILGVGVSTLTRYERGEGFPDSEFLRTICEKFNINPAWLLTGEGGMYRGDSTALLPGNIDLAVISQRIREVRGNLTIPKFIAKLGVIITEEQVYKIESGELEPGYGLLNSICLKLNVNSSWLFGDIQEKNPSYLAEMNFSDFKLIDIAEMAVETLDEMRSKDYPPLTTQKKYFIAGRLYEQLKRKGLDLEKESPSQTIYKSETERRDGKT